MAVEKNASYKVHNGVDFDEINFKTIAEQIKFPDGTSLLDFFNNGGTIGGDFKIRQKLQSNTLFLELLTSGGLGIVVDENGNRIVPKTNKNIDLGSDAYKFKDIYIGDYSKVPNGYTKLPNGLILQWGSIEDVTNSTTTQYPTFPITFPSACIHVGGHVVAEDGLSNVRSAVYSLRINSANSFRFRLGARDSDIAQIRLYFFAIGY